MPYIIRKKIIEAKKSPPELQVKFENERVARYYDLHQSNKTIKVKCIVTMLFNEDCSVKRFVNKSIDFEVTASAYHKAGALLSNGRLILPTDFVRDYAIDANMGLELELVEVTQSEYYYSSYPGQSREEKETLKIFAQERVEGSKDFEIKGISGEIALSSELLVNTLFLEKSYEDLKIEINSCYRIRLFAATMILVRKLFEGLIIDLLRQKYGMGEKELFFSVQDNGFHNLSVLIRNLKGKLDDFKPFGFFKIDREKETFCNFLWDIKEKGNASAHSIEQTLDYTEIQDLKSLLNKYSDLLVKLAKVTKETPK
jgi:hypothetical protein